MLFLLTSSAKKTKLTKNSFSKKLDEKYKTKNTKFLHNFTWEKQAPPPSSYKIRNVWFGQVLRETHLTHLFDETLCENKTTS